MSVSDAKRHWIVRKVSENRGLVLDDPLRGHVTATPDDGAQEALEGGRSLLTGSGA